MSRGAKDAPSRGRRARHTGATTYGSYFSKAANAWMTAPYCYPMWGGLDASPSQIVAAGAKATVTAVPQSNSAQYAPETGSIIWTFPGQRVSGCAMPI